jgi:hypothetical protein
MSRHPARLTARVAQGNDAPHVPFINKEIIYLNAPPTKLPAPTSNTDFNIQLHHFKGLPAYQMPYCSHRMIEKLRGPAHRITARIFSRIAGL